MFIHAFVMINYFLSNNNDIQIVLCISYKTTYSILRLDIHNIRILYMFIQMIVTVSLNYYLSASLLLCIRRTLRICLLKEIN